MEICKEFGYMIKTHRQAMNMTHEQLSEKSGLSVNHISNIENGKVNPKLDTIVQLCSICNIDIGELAVLEKKTHEVSMY